MSFDNDIRRYLGSFYQAPKDKKQLEKIQLYLEGTHSIYASDIQNWLNASDPVLAFKRFASDENGQNKLPEIALKEIAGILQHITNTYVFDAFNPLRQELAARLKNSPNLSPTYVNTERSQLDNLDSDNSGPEGGYNIWSNGTFPLAGLSSLNRIKRGDRVEDMAVEVEADTEDEQSNPDLISSPTAIESGDTDSDMSVSADKNTSSTPINSRSDKKYPYINLYPSKEDYQGIWQTLFNVREMEANIFLSKEELNALHAGEVTHRSVMDKDFSMQRTGEQAFRASVTADELATYTDESHKAITMCCMIDQVVANMLAEGTQLSELSLKLKAPSQALVDAAYLYARTRYGIAHDQLSIEVAGKTQNASSEFHELAKKTPFELVGDLEIVKDKNTKECISKMYEKQLDKIINVEHVNESIQHLGQKLSENGLSNLGIESFLEHMNTISATKEPVLRAPGKLVPKSFHLGEAHSNDVQKAPQNPRL